jgi:phospholipase D1/2
VTDLGLNKVFSPSLKYKNVNRLFFFISQAQTMEMMYRVVAQELKTMNIENANLQDYLNFYCLGNREEPSTNGSPDSDKSTDKSAAVMCCCMLHTFI